MIAALATGEWQRWRWPTPTEAGALAYLAIPLTVGAFILWFGGLNRLGVERAGMFAGLLPIASLVGAAVAHLTLPGAGQVAGTLIVAAGLVAGLAARPRPVPVPAPATAESGQEFAARSAARTWSA
jgi:drug/metabolite transporter (DMT)-like permease